MTIVSWHKDGKMQAEEEASSLMMDPWSILVYGIKAQMTKKERKASQISIEGELLSKVA